MFVLLTNLDFYQLTTVSIVKCSFLLIAFFFPFTKDLFTLSKVEKDILFKCYQALDRSVGVILSVQLKSVVFKAPDQQLKFTANRQYEAAGLHFLYDVDLVTMDRKPSVNLFKVVNVDEDDSTGFKACNKEIIIPISSFLLCDLILNLCSLS